MAGDNSSGGSGLQGLFRTVKRRQGLFLFTFALVTGALAINTLRERIFSPVYEGGFMLQISNPFDRQNTDGNNGPDTVEQIARSVPKADVPSLIVLMRSPLLIAPVAEKLGLPINQIRENLDIVQEGAVNNRGTVNNVLSISLRWGDPVKGRQILRTLSEDYVKFSLTQRKAALDSGVAFLDQQAPELMKRMEKLQAELRQFRNKYKLIEPAPVAAAIIGSRDRMVTQLSGLQVEQVELESRLASIASGKLSFSPSGAPTADKQLGPTSLATAGRGQGSQGSEGAQTPSSPLFDYEQQLANARAVFKEASPIVQSLKARRDELLPVFQRQAADQVRAQLLANVAQQDELNRQILLLNENFRSSPPIIKQYDDIQQRLAVARDNFSSYIRARETFRLERARFITPWQVIAPPEFGDVPVEPNIQSNLTRAILLGLLAALAATILRERTDNVFHTPMEAEKELQLPVLGLIPYLPLEPDVEISTSIAKMSASERFAIKESLRSLFTTFRLLRADRDIRMVGITSSTQGEGKSTAITVFARTLADLGLKVLVVDADMRLPMQNRYLGVAQDQGLSTVLSDPAVSVESQIHSLQENMDILPSGPKPPDPAKLLNSMRCQEVLAEIRAMTMYDLILFDSPPCLMLADPILLGEKLDGILFLVGLGKVSRDLAPQACRRIKATGVDVLGLICNQVSFPSRLNDYGYEYGYYYHYAYANSNYRDRYAGSYASGTRQYARAAGTYAGSNGDGAQADRYVDDAASRMRQEERGPTATGNGAQAAGDSSTRTRNTRWRNPFRRGPGRR